MYKIKWILEISRRFSRVDRKGRSAATSRLATLGICFGVMTLTVVMSIMNGFQLSSVEPILEISSYHVRAEEIAADDEQKFIDLCKNNKSVDCVVPFYEAQSLMTGTYGKDSSAIIRAVSPDLYDEDSGFRKEMNFYAGSFDLYESDSIILGSSLARNLGVSLGSSVNLLVLSGGSDVELFSEDRVFTVTGIFNCGYSDINNSFAFIGINDALDYFGEFTKKNWGIKLKDSQDDMHIVTNLQKEFPDAVIKSWREYNKSFYGALRIEKNMLLLLVALIFVVVAINIYNGMRRLVFERRGEIAILSAIGAGTREIKSIFIMRGLLTGLIGAVAGVLIGVLISVNTEFVFKALAKIMYFFQYLGTAIFNRQNLDFIQENSSYLLYSNIPARIFVHEVILIALFGVVSPVIACWAASRHVLKLTISEVLHNE